MFSPKFLINALELDQAEIEKLRQEFITRGQIELKIRFGLRSRDETHSELLLSTVQSEGFLVVEQQSTLGLRTGRLHKLDVFVAKKVDLNGDELEKTIEKLREIAEIYNAELITLEILKENKA